MIVPDLAGRRVLRVVVSCEHCKRVGILTEGDVAQINRDTAAFMDRHVHEDAKEEVRISVAAQYSMRRDAQISFSVDLGGVRGEAGPGEEADAARH